MKTIVIYHRADFDGLFCREISRKFLPDAELIGWDFKDAPVKLPWATDESFTLYIMDLPVDRVLGLDKATSHSVFAIAPNIVWIDHHKSSIESHATDIPGYRIDGVAACRLTWQWFTHFEHLVKSGYHNPNHNISQSDLPKKEDYAARKVEEPIAVRLAGEYDIWDKRDPRAELFQHGLRSRHLSESCWELLLSDFMPEQDGKKCAGQIMVEALLDAGEALQYAHTQENASIIRDYGFTVEFEGLKFLCCNHARFNSHLFTAGIKPEHDALLGFNWNGQKGVWRISLYHAPGHEQHDLSLIATKYKGGGHRGACGFELRQLPFLS